MKNKPMRVCMLTTSFPRWEGDPSGPFVYSICRHLVKKGIIVDVVTPHDIKTKKFEKIEGINVHRFQYFFPRSLQRVAYGSAGIPENLKKGFVVKAQFPFFMLFFLLKGFVVSKDCDIINAHWAPCGVVANFLKKVRRKKVILHIYGAGIFVNYARWVVKSAIKNADFAISISSYTQKKALEIQKPKKSAVIPWAIDLKRYNPRIKGGFVRKKFNIPDDTPIIFCLGRLVERKGFDYLIRAMNEVEKNAILIIGGGGPKKEDLVDLVENLNLENRVTFAGRIPDAEVPFYYKDCDIFVLPSIIDTKGDTEGLGLVLAEAMATEKPVIGSDVGGIVDIINDGENGFLVEQKNPKVLAEKINYLLDNPDICEKFGKAGRKWVENEFSWEKVTNRTIEIYNIVLGG